MSRNNKFPDQPEELPFDVAPPTVLRFEPDNFRAFGSVPKMLRDDSRTIRFEDIDTTAWELSAPKAIENGLFGVEGGYSVNGLVLGAEYYEAIIRSHAAFQTSVRGKTASASRQSNDQRKTEKELHSVEAALASKDGRHNMVLATLARQREVLSILMDMHRTPGYHRRVSDVDVREMATTAREGVFGGMLRALGDQHEISANELVEVERALDYRLLQGGSRERMQEWGTLLEVGNRYTKNLESLFTISAHKIERARLRVGEELDSRGFESIIRSRGRQALHRTIEK